MVENSPKILVSEEKATTTRPWEVRKVGDPFFEAAGTITENAVDDRGSDQYG